MEGSVERIDLNLVSLNLGYPKIYITSKWIDLKHSTLLSLRPFIIMHDPQSAVYDAST